MDSGKQLALNGFFDAGETSLAGTESDTGFSIVPTSDTSEASPVASSSAELGSEQTFDGIDPARLAPMLRQYVELKRQYPEHMILFQVGDFYEVFYDDALKVSEVLGIRLTSRDRSETNRTPMCGVPVHAIESYLPRLLEGGLSCVIFSQVEEDRKKTNIVRREISRIVTPGVRFEGDGLEEKRLNYLAAFLSTVHGGALAYTDVSTGRFRVLETETFDEALEALERVRPSELVLPLTLFRRPVERDTAEWREVKRVCRELGIQTVLRPAPEISPTTLDARLTERVSATATVRTESFSREARASVEMVLNYVDEIAFGKAPKISSFERVDQARTVVLDGSTCRNLELFETRIDRNKRHSLLAHVDRCRTSMGSRLLHTWVQEPSCDLRVIHDRFDCVENFVNETDLVEGIRKDLLAVRDLERILSRVSCNRVTPRDLLGLRDSLAVFPSIKSALGRADAQRLQEMYSAFDSLSELAEELERSLAEDAPAKISDGGIFRIGYSSELDELRKLRMDANQFLAALEADERGKTGISNLKVRYNGVFGYFLEVSKSHLGKVPNYFERRQTLANAERFVTHELKELEQRILSAKARELEVERELFVELRRMVSNTSDRLQRMCTILSEVDVLAAFGTLARERDYARPILTNDFQAYDVKGGRHPVVEEVVGRHRFIPNDTLLDSDGRRCAILTGPNMGGKSTYLRQIGLIQILAQMGSFVPAQAATLPVVDRVFTRIGSADDLSRGDSTFMVEMREATAIIRKATKRSLVLIDEVGRGTATSDGLAIATAIVEWLHERVQCKTVFATHFHELTGLAAERKGMICLSVGVVERGQEIEFTHRIEERPADRSYGIEVARLAGLPEELLARAEQLLLEPITSAQQKSRGCDDMTASLPTPTSSKKTFPESYSGEGERLLRLGGVVEELRKVDVERLAPIEALLYLQKVREQLLRAYDLQKNADRRNN